MRGFLGLRPTPPLFDRNAARSALGAVSFVPDNRRLADYWLSLWDGDALPLRRHFEPRRVPNLLSGICIFDVVPNKQVTCRLAGSAIRQALGYELKNTDWLAHLAPGDRPVRLSRFTELTLGTAAWSLRRARYIDGHDRIAEEILLPFGDVGLDDVRHVMTHSAWRPAKLPLDQPQLSGAENLSIEFRTIQLAKID